MSSESGTWGIHSFSRAARIVGGGSDAGPRMCEASAAFHKVGGFQTRPSETPVVRVSDVQLATDTTLSDSHNGSGVVLLGGGRGHRPQ